MAHAADRAPAGRAIAPVSRPAEAPSLRWVLFATLLGLALRGWALGANSLWVDEVATLQVARHPFGAIPGVALRGDAFEPPLYFWLVHLAIGVGGISEVALRLLSAVAGAALVPLTWRLVRELDGSPLAADLSATFVALNPLLLWYAQEARPYALLSALGLASLLSLALALRRGGWRYWAGYAGLGGLALLTHAVAVVFPAIGLSWVLLAERPRRALVPFGLASSGMVLVIAPLLVPLARAVLAADSTGSPPRALTGLEVPYTLFTFVAGYSFGPAVREIQNSGWADAVRAHPVQTIVATGALALWGLLVWRLRTQTALRLALLLVVPVAATFLGSVITTKAYNVRYTVPAVVGFAGLLGLGLARLPVPSRAGVTIALAALSMWADVQWFTVPTYWKEDSRAAAACVQAALPTGGVVAVAPGYMASALRHYVVKAGAPLRVEPVGGIADLDPRQPPSALLLTRLHHVADPAGLARAYEEMAAPVGTATVPGYRLLLRDAPMSRCGAAR